MNAPTLIVVALLVAAIAGAMVAAFRQMRARRQMGRACCCGCSAAGCSRLAGVRLDAQACSAVQAESGVQVRSGEDLAGCLLRMQEHAKGSGRLHERVAVLGDDVPDAQACGTLRAVADARPMSPDVASVASCGGASAVFGGDARPAAEGGAA